MNQTKRPDKPKLSQTNVNNNTNRRPKRCLVCKKMFAFDKFNEHLQTCTKQQQKRIEESRMKQRESRNYSKYKQISMPTKKKQNQEIPTKQALQEGNRFRIKSMMNGVQQSQYKSNSVLINNSDKKEIKQETARKVVQEIRIQNEIKIQKNNEQILIPNQSIQSIHIQPQPFRQESRNNRPAQVLRSNNPTIVERNEIAPIQNISENNNRRNQLRNPSPEPVHNHQHNQGNRHTLIEVRMQQMPQRQQPQQQGGYDIQALINNSNSIIQFIRNINILGEDETMNTMLSQLQQLNLIAQQIVQLSTLGHSFGTTMGNVFAARIHELQTVITNQIGIALIRGFNERLGTQFQGLIQRRPEIKEGFTEAQIQQLFPEKINFNRKECSICLDDMKPSQLIIELQCYHLFHPDCIKQWLISSRKCPMCRKIQQEVK